MARPGFVHEVDPRTPPLAVSYGDGFRLESLPLGTQVIFPPESLPVLDDLGGAIDAALSNPLSSDPLAEQLHAGMKLTIAFDDVSVPAPQMRKPDIRGRIIEQVLGLAAAAGVDDVELVVGNGLNRRITEAEMQHLLGERVYRSFCSDGRLNNHDAVDPETNVAAGTASINKRAAESDLLIYVHLVTGLHGHGYQAVLNGLGSAETQAQHKGLAAVRQGAASAEISTLDGVRVFAIEAVLNNDSFTSGLQFLGKREWDWNLKERVVSTAVRQALSLAPQRAKQRVLNSAKAGFGVIQVRAGDPKAVAEQSVAKVTEQQLVEVSGQSDVVITGVGQYSPHNADSIMNPMLAAWSALSQVMGANTGTPVVREGGAVVIYHPAPNIFSALHHPSSVDFFAEVLTSTTDAEQLQQQFEAKYAGDAWYAHLYQTSYAFHGVHPFYVWYEIAKATQYCGDIIWVGAHRSSVERMGFRSATTLHDALEIVASTVGRSPKINFLHTPPQLIADVK